MSRPIRIIGVPQGMGAGRPGAEGGPRAIREEGLLEILTELGYRVSDAGDLDVPPPRDEDGPIKARHVKEIAGVCAELARRVRETLAAGEFPLVLGGDHSIAAGTVAGASSHFRKQGRRLGVLWIDAHADMNTPDASPSGNVHGMSLAASLGLRIPGLRDLEGFSPKFDHKHIALVGVRDIDRDEAELIRQRGVCVYTMRDIDMRGMFAVMNEAIERVTEGTAGVHVSLDVDVLDPSLAPGTGTTVLGGLTYREAHLALEMVADSRRLISLECVEVNPSLDRERLTSRMAAGLIASALGKNIMHQPVE